MQPARPGDTLRARRKARIGLELTLTPMHSRPSFSSTAAIPPPLSPKRSTTPRDRSTALHTSARQLVPVRSHLPTQFATGDRCAPENIAPVRIPHPIYTYAAGVLCRVSQSSAAHCLVVAVPRDGPCADGASPLKTQRAAPSRCTRSQLASPGAVRCHALTVTPGAACSYSRVDLRTTHTNADATGLCTIIQYPIRE